MVDVGDGEQTDVVAFTDDVVLCTLFGREFPSLGVVGIDVLNGSHRRVSTREAFEVDDSAAANLLVFAKGCKRHSTCRSADKAGGCAIDALLQAALCAYGVGHDQGVAVGQYGHGARCIVVYEFGIGRAVPSGAVYRCAAGEYFVDLVGLRIDNVLGVIGPIEGRYFAEVVAHLGGGVHGEELAVDALYGQTSSVGAPYGIVCAFAAGDGDDVAVGKIHHIEVAFDAAESSLSSIGADVDDVYIEGHVILAALAAVNLAYDKLISDGVAYGVVIGERGLTALVGVALEDDAAAGGNVKYHRSLVGVCIDTLVSDILAVLACMYVHADARTGYHGNHLAVAYHGDVLTTICGDHDACAGVQHIADVSVRSGIVEGDALLGFGDGG